MLALLDTTSWYRPGEDGCAARRRPIVCRRPPRLPVPRPPPGIRPCRINDFGPSRWRVRTCRLAASLPAAVVAVHDIEPIIDGQYAGPSHERSEQLRRRRDPDASGHLSHKAVARVAILERLYAIVRLAPLSGRRIRALKKAPTHYHLDWTLTPSPAASFENLVAIHLLEWVHNERDVNGRDLRNALAQGLLHEILFVECPLVHMGTRPCAHPSRRGHGRARQSWSCACASPSQPHHFLTRSESL